MPDAIPQTLPSALAAWLRRHKDMQVISATQLVDVRRIRIHTDCVTSDDKPTLLVITKR
ncbi:MAG: hypothetical protein Q7R81_07735 [Candidatus Peregrinibacteria bacterium]|nr:hypothetical protein [Candidatus Peregrinibacteria bacterium]